jgi:hypothetical protein
MLGHGTPIHSRRSIHKMSRVFTLIGFCAVSWGASAALIATPVAASTCMPLGSTCAPDNFTGDSAGTFLASQTSSFQFPGTFSGTYSSAVYMNSGGTLDFYFQASIDSGSANITPVTLGDFTGTPADMGYRTDGSAIGGGPFVDGSQIPSDVTRATNGGSVAWGFAGPSAVNMLSAGTTSMVLEVKTKATDYSPGGEVVFTSGSDRDLQGVFEPSVTPMSSIANPSRTETGATLQDSATLSAGKTPDGSGSITFNLYGPGDTACSTPIHTEIDTHVTNDGPWNTSLGYVPTTPGTYQWVASFSGDTNNPSGSTGCGDEPVVVTLASQITSGLTTCSQFAGGTSSTLFGAHYSVLHGKINAVTPAKFSYWASVVSTGGTETYSLDQFANETSRQFHLAPGSALSTAGCSSVAALIGQSGGVVTVKFNGGTAGTTYFIGLKFSTSAVVGEAAPKPNGTVRYLFKALGSESEFDLVK